MFTVYVLYNEEYAKHYTGFTSQFDQRMISHNQLGKDWTSRYRPWEIVYTRVFPTKAEAIEHEKWLKTGVGREFIKNVVK